MDRSRRSCVLDVATPGPATARGDETAPQSLHYRAGSLPIHFLSYHLLVHILSTPLISWNRAKGLHLLPLFDKSHISNYMHSTGRSTVRISAGIIITPGRTCGIFWVPIYGMVTPYCNGLHPTSHIGGQSC